MKEQLITFETAKLAKEKGFDEICYSYYKNEELKLGPFCKTITSNLYGNRTEIFKYTNSEKDNHITAPTQSLLQKWLRDEKRVQMYLRFWNGSPTCYEYVFRYIDDNKISHTIFSEDRFYSYEEALEEGLQEALKLIS